MSRALAVGLTLVLFVVPYGSGVGSRHIVTPPQPVPPSYFGMHIQHTAISVEAAPLTPWPRVPVPEWRLWDARVTWPDIEPEKGVWRFDTLDKSVAMARQHNAEVMLTLGFTPPWASARPQEAVGYNHGWAAEPADLEDWRVFVPAVATRYKGRIHVYEIWNEPNLTKVYWTGSTEQMIALVREADQIIKSIDPSAILVSPSATSDDGVKWLSEFLSKGGGQYVDVIGYHFYVFPADPEAMVPLIEKVKQVMLSNGAGHKPLWNTESGWPDPKPFPSAGLAAAYLARAFILNWALGVQRFYWYSWDDHTWVSIQTTEKDNATLTPSGRAYGIMQDWLVSAKMTACDEGADHTWICELVRNGSSQWIAWNPVVTKMFGPPSTWHIEYVTSLLQKRSAFKESSLRVGPAPKLFAAYR
jgi:Glycosyl hydrolases family 39